MPITKATASSIAPAAKGDLVVGSATNDASVLAVGTNDQVLTADSSTTTGLKWATASSGGMTLLATHTLSGTTSTISGISGSYTDLVLISTNAYNSENAGVKVYLNGNTTNTNYYTGGISWISGNPVDGSFANNPDLFQVSTGTSYNDSTYFYLHIPRYAESNNKFVMCRNLNRASRVFFTNLLFNSTSAITSVGFNVSSGSWSGGTVYVYGVK